MHAIDLNNHQFQKISQLVYRYCGIALKDGKQALVRARLMKRLRSVGLQSFDEYMRYIDSPAGESELAHLIDVMTTNKTNFFREADHFDFLKDVVLPAKAWQRLRIWSAACSSGEEPYSIAIQLRECLTGIDNMDVLILATDISNRILAQAREATYEASKLSGLPAAFRHKYFSPDHHNGPNRYRLKDSVRRLVRLAKLNLLDAWPMKGPFDVIFCRNVMIYFDRPTQQQLINRFWDILAPSGYLLVGHSEGLSGIRHAFRYIRPATYQK